MDDMSAVVGRGFLWSRYGFRGGLDYRRLRHVGFIFLFVGENESFDSGRIVSFLLV